MYFKRIPTIIKRLFPSIIWDLPNDENKVYLTFDDGPHPEITPWILEELRKHNAKATFFCLGKNVEKYPKLLKLILSDGHAIGNHGYAHLNGWKTNDNQYLEDFEKSERILRQTQNDSKQVLDDYSQDSTDILRQAQNDSKQVQNDNAQLFRPAYGKIKKSQISLLKSHSTNLKSDIVILNWSLMPGDFDKKITSEQCYNNLQNVKSGDIIVLHDNEKSWKHLEYCLPKFLEFCEEKNFSLNKLNL